jgi:hypothetical protein
VEPRSPGLFRFLSVRTQDDTLREFSRSLSPRDGEFADYSLQGVRFAHKRPL